ncbi:hypothetical protein SODG_004841 [Sodalis praecaptivus]
MLRIVISMHPGDNHRHLAEPRGFHFHQGEQRARALHIVEVGPAGAFNNFVNHEDTVARRFDLNMGLAAPSIDPDQKLFISFAHY